MKMTFSLFLFVMFWCGQCISQKQDKEFNEETISADTMFVLQLRNRQYEPINYKIIQLRTTDIDNSGYQIKKIILCKNNETLNSILLPNSVDVKNFSINKILETEEGFKLEADWGGGKYFYERQFYFSFKNEQFYFDSLQMRMYKLEPEKEISQTRSINPPVPIDEFSIMDYLQNE